MRTFLDGEVLSLQDEDIKKISDAITAGGKLKKVFVK